MNSTLNFGIPIVFVFQLEVYYKVDRLLTGLIPFDGLIIYLPDAPKKRLFRKSHTNTSSFTGFFWCTRYMYKIVFCRIFDTSGQEEYEQIRKGAYNATDVLFIAFSIVKRDSFLNIKRLWLREQKRFMPKVKVMASVFMLFSYYRKVLKNVTIQ